MIWPLGNDQYGGIILQNLKHKITVKKYWSPQPCTTIDVRFFFVL